MDHLVTDRVKKSAEVILAGQLTVREVATIVGYSKSTVHKDLTERLPKIDPLLYNEVSNLLKYNKKIRHIRGRLSTKLKYATHPHQH